ncbi:ABC transporter ATP-binding protein [Pseudonocardia endophytica]|uniref:ABC transporter ATP-binding protein n=1 Tax=Pseudonocardia endophytica TaxID=401976 RepID=UPI001FB46984|nr:ABC transporter ATP-binding protein [Pseudonocardia endophytica]
MTGLVREFAAGSRSGKPAPGGRRILDGLDLTVGDGEFVALLGRSGSGKSTLLRILAGLDTVGDDGVSGTVDVPGSVAMAFQEPRLLPWRSVRDNVSLGLHRDDAAGITDRTLAEVGLAERADAWPLTLSGGEAQRASLARALVREPELLLLDEPFGALDALTRIAMHRLVLDLWTTHRPGVLLVTHDVDEALLLADRVLVLDGGVIGQEHRPGPRPRRPEDLVELRRRVLTELGVDDDAA